MPVFSLGRGQSRKVSPALMCWNDLQLKQKKNLSRKLSSFSVQGAQMVWKIIYFVWLWESGRGCDQQLKLNSIQTIHQLGRKWSVSPVQPSAGQGSHLAGCGHFLIPLIVFCWQGRQCVLRLIKMIVSISVQPCLGWSNQTTEIDLTFLRGHQQPKNHSYIWRKGKEKETVVFWVLMASFVWTGPDRRK